MFVYQKKLQYPVRIRKTNPKLASQIITQYGGPDCNRLQRAGSVFQVDLSHPEDAAVRIPFTIQASA